MNTVFPHDSLLSSQTKYQTEDIAQMVVVAESAIEDPYEKDGGADEEGENEGEPARLCRSRHNNTTTPGKVCRSDAHKILI